MKTSNSFYMIDKALDAEFKGEYTLLRQLIEYIELYSVWQFNKKLQDDGSFYCSDGYMANRLGLSRQTVIKNRNELQRRGYLSYYTNLKVGSVTYIYLNTGRLNDIQNKSVVETIDDYSQDNVSIMVETPIVKVDKEKEKEKQERVKLVIESWNALAEKYELSKIAMIKQDRWQKYLSVLNYLNMTDTQFFEAISDAISHSNFLQGLSQKWHASFDFFLQKGKALKAIEGAYKDNNKEVMHKLQDTSKLTYREAEKMRQDLIYKQLLEAEKAELNNK